MEFGAAQADRARRFHEGMPGYAPTPLVSLPGLAGELGIGGLLVKDESGRFGLRAFKALGGSYAIFRVLCERLGLDPEASSFADVASPEHARRRSQVEFVTATDGNHGRGVAWSARQFGCRSHVLMPAGTVEARRQAIADVGADDVAITSGNYDETVEQAAGLAAEHGWEFVQDTSWPGYEQVPRWIMQGYLTLADEVVGQVQALSAEQGIRRPTHVLLQAGVGSMAASVMERLLDAWSDRPPAVGIVEPRVAACIRDSAAAGDGAPHSVPGSPRTVMAGLNCGTPCSIAWPALRDLPSWYLTCDDSDAERAMRRYAHPADGDAAIESGESGASTLGALLGAADDEAARRALGLGPDSVVLLVSTEGATDPGHYREAVGEAVGS